jgi:hypothetical protein
MLINRTGSDERCGNLSAQRRRIQRSALTTGIPVRQLGCGGLYRRLSYGGNLVEKELTEGIAEVWRRSGTEYQYPIFWPRQGSCCAATAATEKTSMRTAKNPGRFDKLPFGVDA